MPPLSPRALLKSENNQVCTNFPFLFFWQIGSRGEGGYRLSQRIRLLATFKSSLEKVTPVLSAAAVH
jgi:hypothetical protein